MGLDNYTIRYIRRYSNNGAHQRDPRDMNLLRDYHLPFPSRIPTTTQVVPELIVDEHGIMTQALLTQAESSLRGSPHRHGINRDPSSPLTGNVIHFNSE